MFCHSEGTRGIPLNQYIDAKDINIIGYLKILFHKIWSKGILRLHFVPLSMTLTSYL